MTFWHPFRRDVRHPESLVFEAQSCSLCDRVGWTCPAGNRPFAYDDVKGWHHYRPPDRDRGLLDLAAAARALRDGDTAQYITSLDTSDLAAVVEILSAVLHQAREELAARQTQ